MEEVEELRGVGVTYENQENRTCRAERKSKILALLKRLIPGSASPIAAIEEKQGESRAVRVRWRVHCAITRPGLSVPRLWIAN